MEVGAEGQGRGMVQGREKAASPSRCRKESVESIKSSTARSPECRLEEQHGDGTAISDK